MELKFKRSGVSTDKDETTAFLQTWLYFGLLSDTLEAFSPDVQRRFVEEGSDKERLLTTHCLEEMVIDWSWKWVKAIFPTRSTQNNELFVAYDRFQTCIKTIQTVFLYAQRPGFNLIETSHLLALMALASYLTTTWRLIYRHFHGEPPKEPATIQVGKATSNRFLQEHMRRENWCPSDIARIVGNSSATLIWYYANLQPPRSKMDHSRCSDVVCFTTQTSLKPQYELAHTTSGCTCHLVRARIEDLREVLLADDIPVLGFEENSEIGKCGVSVHKSSEADFVAISHIWAEGLGDPHDNALHYCEVKRLFDLIRQLPVRGLQQSSLWIDTMCVPVHDYPLKKAAMLKMKDTYSLATDVLVLDAYLQSFERMRASPLEAFARVVNSSWMLRYWTLQEGRLARRLWFQFADGPVELRQIFHTISLKPFPAEAAYAANVEITMSYRASKLHTTQEEEAVFKALYSGILAVRKAVMSRDLSVDSDEALCLAFLMNLDIGPILDVDESKRMERFWSLMPKLPLSLVFSRAASKLPTSGFHWAPSSFRGPVPHDIHDWWAGPHELWGEMKAEPTVSGLLVELPGIFLHPTETKKGWSVGLRLNSAYTFQTHDRRWFAVFLREAWSQLTMDSHPEQHSEKVALILQTTLSHEPHFKSDAMANDFLAKPTLNAVAARVKHGHGNEFYVAGLQHAEIQELPPDFSINCTAAVNGARKLWERLPSATSESNLIAECVGVARESLLEPKVLSACRNQRSSAGLDDSDIEIRAMLAGMTHMIYTEGYNAAEIAAEGCKWYID